MIGKYIGATYQFEDLEFHKRMNKNNLKTYLNTGITNTYYSRSNYWNFLLNIVLEMESGVFFQLQSQIILFFL